MFSNGVDPPGAAGVELMGFARKPGEVVDWPAQVVDAAVVIGDRVTETCAGAVNHAATSLDRGLEPLPVAVGVKHCLVEKTDFGRLQHREQFQPA